MFLVMQLIDYKHKIDSKCDVYGTKCDVYGIKCDVCGIKCDVYGT